MEKEQKMQNGHQFVKDVLKERYRIPKYQRGYRWTETNVEKLLQDVYEDRLYRGATERLIPGVAILNFRAITFEQCEGDEEDRYRLSHPKNPYCIQPLVVTRTDAEQDVYDVIDGQQRLTTIAIIRAALKSVFGLEEISAPEIEYESRKDSREYLKKLYGLETASESEILDNNIDFAYMKQAYEKAVMFYTECKLDIVNGDIQKSYGGYLDAVLCENTRFIWYEVPKDAPQEVFANFNTGKIELTNAELIKALFMNPENYQTQALEDRQIVISEKWDEMENQLWNADFWAFVPHPNQYRTDTKVYGTRIDLLFDFLVMDNWLEKNDRKTVSDYLYYRDNNASDKYIFEEIERWILEKLGEEPKDKDKVMDKCWRCVGRIFSNIRELYYNTELYNSVGLYINLRSREPNKVDSYVTDKRTYLEIYGELKEIIKEPRKKRLQLIKEKISEIVFRGSDIEKKLKGVRYSDGNNADIVNLLMVYNIALLSTSKAIGERFNYLANASNKWQREHIFAKNVKVELNEEERESVLKILTGEAHYEYLRYLFPDKTIEFTEEEKKYVFRADEPEKNAKEFVKARLRYDRESVSELWARAVYARMRAEEIIKDLKCCRDIEYLLAVEDNNLKEMLISRYVEHFREEENFEEEEGVEEENSKNKFFQKRNINLEYCQDVTDSILNADIDMGAKRVVIKIAQIDFRLEFDFPTEKEEVSKEVWQAWLQELQDDNQDSTSKNHEKVRSRLQERYINELKRKEYGRVEFWEKALLLHKETLMHEVDKFFEKELVRLLEDNSMGNMTLLTGNVSDESRTKDEKSARQNQVVNDKTYKEKRTLVYQFYKEGQFVPLGSLFIFTDLYTQTVNASSLWLPDSRYAYLKDMIETVKKYLTTSEEKANE